MRQVGKKKQPNENSADQESTVAEVEVTTAEKSADNTQSERNVCEKGAGIPALSKKARFWLGVAIVGFIVCLVFVGVYLLKARMFDKNPHFIVRNVRIVSQNPPDTYWAPRNETKRNQREQELQQSLGIVLNETNTFKLDLPDKRRKFLAEHPEVQSIEVERQLPDTLRFHLKERIPLICIGFSANDQRKEKVERFVAMDYVIISNERMNPVSVPQVSVFPLDNEFNKLNPGDDASRNEIVKQAFCLVNLINGSFQKIHLESITMRKREGSMLCTIVYDSTKFLVALPFYGTTDRYKRLLSMLQPQLVKKASMENGYKIDMCNNDQIVVRELN